MKSFFTALVTGAILLLLERQTRKTEKKRQTSIKKFRIKLSLGYFWLGAIVASLGAVIIWGGMTFEEDFTLGVAIIVGIATLPGWLLMIFPLSGVWEIQVNQDDITVIKAFVFKKHFLFSEITHCKSTRGGFKVYVKGRKRKGFFVDRMMDGAGLFTKRAEAANIPLIMTRMKEEEE